MEERSRTLNALIGVLERAAQRLDGDGVGGLGVHDGSTHHGEEGGLKALKVVEEEEEGEGPAVEEQDEIQQNASQQRTGFSWPWPPWLSGWAAAQPGFDRESRAEATQAIGIYQGRSLPVSSM